MTIRKRRMRAPGFGMPTPYNPLTGQYETLAPTGHYPYCAMMQVAEDDTHEDYVVCRGWDTRVNRFFDAVSVAKPYGKRAKYIYRIGQVYPAVLPWMRLGENWAPSQNPGVAETTQGHPADLDEEVEILYDDDSKVINWMLLDCGGLPEFYNDSGEEVSAYAIMAVTGVQTLDSGKVVKKIGKPSTTLYREYIVNSSLAVADESVGLYQLGPEIQVAYTGGTPAAGKGWGPQPDAWTVSADYPETCMIEGTVDADSKIAKAQIHTLDRVPFQLKTSLTPGGGATAYVATSDGTIIDDSTPWTVTVQDTVGGKRAIGKDDRAAGGGVGLAEYLANGTLAITYVRPMAKRCSCLIDAGAGIDDADASVNVDNVTPIDGGMIKDSDNDDITVYIQRNVQSTGGYKAADNTVMQIEWNESEDKWYIYDGPCHPDCRCT